MSKRPNKMQAYSAQTARIADEGRQVVVKPAAPDKVPEADRAPVVEATASQPREAVEPPVQEAVKPEAQEAVKPASVKRTSTSLYLTPAAHREIRLHAADKGLKSNQVYEAALKLYFKQHDLGDFDKING